MKRRFMLLPLSAVIFSVVFFLIFSVCGVQSYAASAYTLKSFKMTDSGYYVKWSGGSSTSETCLQIAADSGFSDIIDDDFGISAGKTSFTFNLDDIDDGTTLYARVGDGEGTWSNAKKLTVKASYSYDVTIVNPYCEVYTDNSSANIMIFIQTDNPDTSSFKISVTDSSGDSASVSTHFTSASMNMFPDLKGIDSQDSYGYYPVSGGYLLELGVETAGKYKITLYEKTAFTDLWRAGGKITCSSASVTVQDYDTARQRWIEDMADEIASDISSSMTTAEKIAVVGSYIDENFSYKTRDNEEYDYVYLYAEKGTFWQKKQLDSLSAPSVALDILEELGVTGVSSGYVASGRNWDYHATIVDSDGVYYTICPSGGVIDLDDIEIVNLTKVKGTSGYHTYGSGSGTLTCSVCGNQADSLKSASVSLSKTSYTYNGTSRKPSVTVTYSGTKLKKGRDYTVTYSSNKNAGTAKVTIKGIGDYGGTVTKTFTIKAKSIKSAAVTLSETTYTYDGTTKKPSVTVKITLNSKTKKLTKGTNYTVSYANGRKSIGKYTVKIKGTGNYTGTITKTFKIVPKKVSLKSSTKSSASKKLTVKWSKVSGSVKYQIAYKVKGGSWKYKTVSASTYSKTLAGLKSGKYYYVKVRAYKSVDGTKYYGSWSATKKVKVK